MKKKIFYSLILSLLSLFVLSFSSDNPKPYIFDYNKTFPEPFVPRDNPMTIEGVQLGRLLFYDPILSGNNTQSCSSCHKQEFGFSDGLQVSLGAEGSTINRNSISLLNLAWDSNYFWDGRVNSLEELMINPITHPKEMNQDTSILIKELKADKKYKALFKKAFPSQDISFRLISKALSQFVRTIITKGVSLPEDILPSRLLKGVGPEPMEIEGYMTELSPRGTFFRFSEMCSRCHNKPIYGGYGMAYNGVKMNDSIKKVKIPSLINILKTGPYMHDGRFKTIKEVLIHYKNNLDSLHLYNPEFLEAPIKNVLLDYDIENAEAFFKYLTDSSLLNNKNLSNPFVNLNSKQKN